MEILDLIITKSHYLYKVWHCAGSEEDSIFFKSKIPPEKLIEILGCIDFKFEELVEESGLMDEESVLEILEKFYAVTKLSDELIKMIKDSEAKEFEENGFPIVSNRILTIYNINNEEHQLIEIDRYGAREYCCGPGYTKLMKKHLPNTVEFIEMVKQSSIA